MVKTNLTLPHYKLCLFLNFKALLFHSGFFFSFRKSIDQHKGICDNRILKLIVLALIFRHINSNQCLSLIIDSSYHNVMITIQWTGWDIIDTSSWCKHALRLVNENLNQFQCEPIGNRQGLCQQAAQDQSSTAVNSCLWLQTGKWKWTIFYVTIYINKKSFRDLCWIFDYLLVQMRSWNNKMWWYFISQINVSSLIFSTGDMKY